MIRKSLIYGVALATSTVTLFGGEYDFYGPNSSKSISHWKAPKAFTRAMAVPEATTSSQLVVFTREGMSKEFKEFTEVNGITLRFWHKFPELLVYQIDNYSSDCFTALTKDPAFINVIPLAVSDKISSDLYNNPKGSSTQHKVEIVYKNEATLEEIITLASGYGIELDPEASLSKPYFLATFDEVKELVQEDIITFVSLYKAIQITNYEARTVTNVDIAQDDVTFGSTSTTPTPSWLAENINVGEGVTACINEWGGNWHVDLCELVGNDTILRTPEVANKKLTNSYWGLSKHGLHVAGIVAANGWTSNSQPYVDWQNPFKYRGVSPKTSIIRDGEKGDVNNHSFTNSDSKGYYVDEWEEDNWYASHSANEMSASEKNGRVGIFSAANQGQSAQYGVQRGYFSTLQNGKNGTVVGATYKDSPVIASFSSCGPTRDGRIKPDVVAPGTGLFTLYKNSYYEFDFDSIAILNNGVKYSWGFSSNSDKWLQERDCQLSVQGGLMNMVMHTGKYGYMRSPDFTGAPVVSDDKDTLYIRWKEVSTHTEQSNLKLGMLWKRSKDSFMKKIGSVYQEVATVVEPKKEWHTLRLPLKDLPGSMWVAGDTLQKIGFWYNVAPENFGDDGIVSCGVASQTTYEISSGTSMSGPHVTGIAALLVGKYNKTIRDSSKHDPIWNSTVRSILIHTAKDLVDTVGITVEKNPDIDHPAVHGVGPDWVTGWGLVQADKALDYVDPAKFIQTTVNDGDSLVLYMNVPQGQSQTRVTLAWDDPMPSNVGKIYEKKLINELDLYVTKVGSNDIKRPWVLDFHPLIDSALVKANIVPSNGIDANLTKELILDNSATRGIDTVNNVEVVDVETPSSGLWKVVIKGTSIVSDQNPDVAGFNQDITVVTDFPAAETITEINTGSNYTLDEVLDFTATQGWSVLYNSCTLEPVYEKYGATLIPNMQISKTIGWARIKANKQLDTFVGKGAESIAAGLHITYPKDPAGVYRGNVQLLINGNWVGQFEINSYGSSVVLDEAAGVWNAYYEFILPRQTVDKMNLEGVEIQLLFGSIKDPGTFIMKKLEFNSRDGEIGTDLWTELDNIAQANNYENSPSVIKSAAQDYDNRDYVNPPLYRLYYRELLDPVDNVRKKFYFQIRQDVDAPMQYAEWWAFQTGYHPDVPWSGTSYWRQCWKYIGNEVIW